MKKRIYASLALLLLSPMCEAGDQAFSAYSIKDCKQYSIEFGGGWPPAGYQRYDPTARQPQRFYWTLASVYSNGTSSTGLCKMVYKSKNWPRYFPAYCEPKSGFILAGASYTTASETESFNFRCIKGCNGDVPRWLYQEPNEVQFNQRYEQARKVFIKFCESS
jgi:hypothetical protein